MGNDGSDHVSDIPWNNIEIDSLQGTLRLLEDRLQCLVMILQECGDREVCTIGVASEIAESCLHACKVVHPGRSSFLWRMVDLLHGSNRSSMQPGACRKTNDSIASDLSGIPV